MTGGGWELSVGEQIKCLIGCFDFVVVHASAG